MVDIKRYARHISLPDVGIQGQTKIQNSRVLVIGAGGLGSPVLAYLAAAGVGSIGIIDDDVIDVSNLQRQIIHSDRDAGMNKVESAKTYINELNPEIKVTIWNERLTPDNAEKVIKGWDIVVDGTDNIPTRYLVDDVCKIINVPWVYGSIYRFEGQVCVFNHNGSPCYRDLFPDPPPKNAIPSCSEGGVFGVLPGVIGSIQATEVLKIILEKGDLLAGRLLIYDAELMKFKELSFFKSSEENSKVDMKQVREMFEDRGWCVKSIDSNGEIQEPSATGSFMFNHLSVSDYKGKRDDGWKPFLVDVRSDLEYSQIRISFTDLQVSHEDLLSQIERIPKDRDVILLCRSGMRSQMAAMFLIDAGFEASRLYNFDGGIISWSHELPSDVA
tara:strand:+ start:3494 stop:4651 length:1158 start_codon:yes stop_codon:yes gene_type:complete